MLTRFQTFSVQSTRQNGSSGGSFSVPTVWWHLDSQKVSLDGQLFRKSLVAQSHNETHAIASLYSNFGPRYEVYYGFETSGRFDGISLGYCRCIFYQKLGARVQSQGTCGSISCCSSRVMLHRPQPHRAPCVDNY
jgi:hypothetical protein